MDTSIGLNSTGILTKQEYDESQLVREPGEDDLDRDAFLTLLTTQLQNQNPLDPMKNEAFVAQLAQFSQLEGITNMSSSLDEVADVIRSDRMLSGANLIGKTVYAPTGTIGFKEGGDAEIQVPLPMGAEQVNLSIYDSATGEQVRSIFRGPQAPGSLSVMWDGLDKNGSPVATGTYLVKAEVSRGGQVEQRVPLTQVPVRSISWSDLSSDLKLNLEGGLSLPMSQISQVGLNQASRVISSESTQQIGE